MPLTFPSNPTLGQQSTQNGRTYQWSGSAWELFTPTVAGGATTDASQLTSGTLADARLSANVVLTGDSRLSDARTPTAHKISHSTGGTDALAPADIGAAAASHTHGGISSDGAIGDDANQPVITTTGGVLTTGTFGTKANTFAAGNHTHGNLTTAGAIGSTANLPVITTTSGVLTTGTFGTAANSFCQGNDARLSDTRTPTDNTVTTAKITNSNVTYAKIQNVSATDRLLGRSTAGAGVVEEIACTAAGRALLDDADAAAQRTTLGLGTMATQASTAYLATTGGTSSGQISVPAVVGLAIAGDSNTGIGQYGGADTIGLVAGGRECLRVNGVGNLNAVIEGGTAQLYPGYVCRSWVNFHGGSNAAALTGTYSQSGTTVTVTTSTAHGFSVGQRLVLDFTSGGNTTDQGADVTAVTSTTVFTVTVTNSLTTSGNVTIQRMNIRGGGNITSVADAGTGSYIVNMFVPAPSANYAVLVSSSHQRGTSLSTSATVDSTQPWYFTLLTAGNTNTNNFDPDLVCAAVFY